MRADAVTVRKVGDLLDSLGVTADLRDDDLPAAAVVLLKIVGDDGKVAIAVGDSEGLSWLDQFAIVGAGWQIVRDGQFEDRENEG